MPPIGMVHWQGKEEALPLRIPDFDYANDPVVRLLLNGQAHSMREAEEQFLDDCLPDVVRLLQSSMTDKEIGEHPLMRMLRSHGSCPWEDSLE